MPNVSFFFIKFSSRKAVCLVGEPLVRPETQLADLVCLVEELLRALPSR